MPTSQIVLDPQGRHNSGDPAARILREGTYKDCSTVIVQPNLGMIPSRVVQSWMNLMLPMNQRVFRIFVENMEVGAAYNAAVEMILANEELSKWRFMLTLEADNMPPPDGLIRLYEHMRDFDVISGLYWTKGEGGQPMIYGDPKVMPKNFIPQVPLMDQVQPCNGLGMGFTLFKIEMFRKVPKPWFRTLQEFTPGQGTRAYSQDLYFYENAAKYGFRFASDNRVKVGHFDHMTGIVW